LGGEDLALFLCAHGAKHLWERLEWLCDLAALLARRPGLDWDAMLARARRRGAERIVLLALHLAHELLGARFLTVSARGRARIGPCASSGSACRARLFAGPHPPTLREARVFHWHVRERWRDRLRSLAHVLFTPGTADRQASGCPPSDAAVLRHPPGPARRAVRVAVRAPMSLCSPRVSRCVALSTRSST